MNWRTDILLAVSILGAANLSCCGPETGTASLRIGAGSDTSSPLKAPRTWRFPSQRLKASWSNRTVAVRHVLRKRATMKS